MDPLMESLSKDLEEILQRVQALQLRLKSYSTETSPSDLDNDRLICWGRKVDSGFKAGVLWIEEQLGLSADNLMACMAFETGGTFSSTIRNAAGSSAIGLIQFMATTAEALGTTTEKLGKMTPLQQLSFVYKYFAAFGKDLSHWGLEDTYMAILYPKAIGKDLDYAMFVSGLAYSQNAGLDKNKDRKVTKGEASAAVQRQYALGIQAENLG